MKNSGKKESDLRGAQMEYFASRLVVLIRYLPRLARLFYTASIIHQAHLPLQPSPALHPSLLLLALQPLYLDKLIDCDR